MLQERIERLIAQLRRDAKENHATYDRSPNDPDCWAFLNVGDEQSNIANSLDEILQTEREKRV